MTEHYDKLASVRAIAAAVQSSKDQFALLAARLEKFSALLRQSTYAVRVPAVRLVRDAHSRFVQAYQDDFPARRVNLLGARTDKPVATSADRAAVSLTPVAAAEADLEAAAATQSTLQWPKWFAGAAYALSLYAEYRDLLEQFRGGDESVTLFAQAGADTFQALDGVVAPLVLVKATLKAWEDNPALAVGRGFALLPDVYVNFTDGVSLVSWSKDSPTGRALRRGETATAVLYQVKGYALLLRAGAGATATVATLGQLLAEVEVALFKSLTEALVPALSLIQLGVLVIDLVLGFLDKPEGLMDAFNRDVREALDGEFLTTGHRRGLTLHAFAGSVAALLG